MRLFVVVWVLLWAAMIVPSLGSEIPSPRPSVDSSDLPRVEGEAGGGRGDQGPKAPLTLADAVREGIYRSSAIALARARLESQSARVRAAGLPPPTELVLSLGVGDVSEESNLLRQELEIAGQPELRRQLASSERDQARADYVRALWENAHKIRQAFVQALAIQESLALDQEILELLKAFLAKVRKQKELGEVPGSHVVRTELEVARAERDVAKSEQAFREAVNHLFLFLGRDYTTEHVALVPWDEAPLTDIESLTKQAVALRPELQSSKARIHAREVQIALIKKGLSPNFYASLNKTRLYRNEEIGASIGITLPFQDWGKNRSEIREAEILLKGAEDAHRLLVREVSWEVSQAYLAAQGARERLKFFQEGAPISARRLVELAQRGYKAGAVMYLEVLEAQRTFKEARKEYLELVKTVRETAVSLFFTSASDLQLIWEEWAK